MSEIANWTGGLGIDGQRRQAPLAWLRFNASELNDDAGAARAVHEIYHHYRRGVPVVAVVVAGSDGSDSSDCAYGAGGSDSADGADGAEAASGDGERRCTAESARATTAAAAAAAASLAQYLDRAGVPVASRRGHGPGAPSLDRGPAAVGGLELLLAQHPVVVVTGFDHAAALPRLHFATALAEPVTAETARWRRRAGGAGSRRATVGKSLPAGRPRNVVLCGLGAVGLGIYRHLASEPELVRVTGVLVREADRPRDGVPDGLLTADPRELLRRRHDLLIEALPGIDPAARLLAATLAAGRDVVTANKAVMAEEGRWLAGLAAATGARLAFSAAVGGALPVLEAVERTAASGEILAIRGVLNGTCNFILDEMAAGASAAAALRQAQRLGFAEADPARDLDGRDAACKLRLLARAAFGVDLAESDVRRVGLTGVDPRAVAAPRRRGEVLRLVGEVRRDGANVVATVRPIELPACDFLAGARGEENRVIIERRGLPPLRLRGRGAGRWPTAEAVMADVFDLVRHRLGVDEAAGGPNRSPFWAARRTLIQHDVGEPSAPFATRPIARRSPGPPVATHPDVTVPRTELEVRS